MTGLAISSSAEMAFKAAAGSSAVTVTLGVTTGGASSSASPPLIGLVSTPSWSGKRSASQSRPLFSEMLSWANWSTVLATLASNSP